jgi:heme-degrading monooxygenase HmoA
MIAVIFEVEPADREAYLGIAAELRPLLDGIDGFISVERSSRACRSQGACCRFPSGGTSRR